MKNKSYVSFPIYNPRFRWSEIDIVIPMYEKLKK